MKLKPTSTSEKRAILLALITEFNLLVCEQKKILGRKFRILKCVRDFCNDKNIKWKTFYSYLRTYQKYGMIPMSSRGKRRSADGSLLNIIEPLLRHIKIQGRPYTHIHQDIVSACKSRGLEIPSYASVARIINQLYPPDGKILSVKKYAQNYRATLIIDRNNPFEAIKQLAEFLESIADNIPAQKPINELLSKCVYFSKVKGIKRMKPIVLQQSLNAEEIKNLEEYKKSTSVTVRNRAICLLMANEHKALLEILTATNAGISTVSGWLNKFKKERLSFVLVKRDRKKNNTELRERKNRIVEILHQSPSDFGINRATWILTDIAKVYDRQYDHILSRRAVSRAIKEANYTWQRARRVLTSNDPEFKIKAQAVLDALRNLKEDEVFFFIDEAGPWQVRKYGGISLTPYGEKKKYPEFQTQKGKITFIGALNAIENQVDWFFIDSKDSSSVICLLTMLYRANSHCSTIYLTWDSASWHSSKELIEHIEKLNDNPDGPVFTVLPLPKKAQYLNVIESVFSGLKKAVILNSNYKNVHEMQMAISRHFHDRNEYFLQNPAKVGHKIWDAELFNLDDFGSGLHKHV